jgi:hypothetical protein
MTYTIYFELFDRKMRYTIEADSPDLAVRKLKDKIIIHKVVPEPDPFVQMMKDIFGIK